MTLICGILPTLTNPTTSRARTMPPPSGLFQRLLRVVLRVQFLLVPGWTLIRVGRSWWRRLRPGGTAGTVPSRTGDPGWGDQPSFFPLGVNCWMATAAQRAAEEVARRAHLAEQAPLRDAVLRYEARGRERDRAIQCHVKVAQACCGPLPPPQGAIRGWGIAGARSSLPSSTSTGRQA